MMPTIWEQFENFKKRKFSEVVEGRKQDLLTWIHPPVQAAADPEATPRKFSFNSALLSPYFQNMARDNKTLPFIEFSTIILFKAPEQTDPKNILDLIQAFLNKQGLYQHIAGDYLDLPLIIQINNNYFLYGNTKGNEWAVTELDARLLSTRRLPFTDTPFQLDFDLQHFPIYHHIIEKKAHTHFSTQPQQVLQLQKVINATFYIQSLLAEFESIKFSVKGILNIGATVIKYFDGTTYTNIYRAITLLSDVEIDFAHRFQEEIGEFLNLLERFKRYSTWKQEKTGAFRELIKKFVEYEGRITVTNKNNFLKLLEKFQQETALNPEEIKELQEKIIDRFKNAPAMNVEEANAFLVVLETFQRYLIGAYQPSLSFQAGHAAGFVTRHIYEPNGQWDVDVLSQFSADLPRHLDMLTTLINSNLSSNTQFAHNINPRQLRALQKEATQLLKTLKSTQRMANSSKFNLLYQMYQIINYVFLIRQILVLLSTTLTQVGQLNDAYQEALRDILTLIKEECIPLLWKYAVRLEVEFILEPGTVTRPTLELINSFYKYLADHIKSLGNFEFLGEHLLVVEDSKFLNQCDQIILDMHQESQQALEKIQWAQEAVKRFFSRLQEHRPDLNDLQSDYAWLSSYVEQIDPQLDRDLSRILKQPTNLSSLKSETIRLLRCRLSAHLQKLYNTEVLRSQQCQAVRSSIPHFTNLHLFPHQDRMGCDIALKIVDDIPLNRLKLSTNYPILIQHRIKTETTYVFYGNTNGTKWGFTPIGEAFIHRGILDHFATIRHRIHKKPSESEALNLLTYRPKYESLYSQMILKKAHTYYRSPFCSFESEALEDTSENLTQKIFKPIDLAEKYCTKQTTAPVQPNASEPDTKPVAMPINQFHDHYPDLTQLSAAQALKLRGWYQQKIAAYNEACQNFIKFKALINQHFRNQPIQFSAQQTELLKQCQYLYHAIRPYCIPMRNFPEFDQKMVRTLSVQEKDKKISIPYIEFNQKLGSFSLIGEQKLIKVWEHRANALLEYAYRKLENTQKQALVSKRVSFTADPRTGFLLKKTSLSTKISEFKEALTRWMTVLHPIIQVQLIPQPEGVPYPDILNLDSQEQAPPFVLFFKRMFNIVYYSEHLAEGLERIRTGDSDEIKNETIELITKISSTHGQGLLDLGLQLQDDPTLRLLYKDLTDQSTVIINYISNLIQPHTADAKKVRPQKEPVSYSGLWYTMNSFYAFPAHLLMLTHQDEQDHNFGYQMVLRTEANASVSVPRVRKLTLIKHDQHYSIYSNGTGNDWKLRDLPPELINTLDIDFSEPHIDYDHRLQPLYDFLIQNEYHHTYLNALQTSSKRATLNIERIIRDSNNYFKLFFDGVMIYQLNKNLQKQAKLFTSTTQEVVMSHLEILENEYFSSLVIKADTKEHEWGLNSGTITEPLVAILNELYQGLIFPLKKTFREKEVFCTNNSILKARIAAETERLRILSAPNEELGQDLDVFHRFTQELTTFNAQVKAWTWTRPEWRTDLSTDYVEKIRSKLNDYRKSFIPDWIKIIPLNLEQSSLKTIQTQVTNYHAHLARLALLHNTEQKQLCEEILPNFLKRVASLIKSDSGQIIPEDLSAEYTKIRPKLLEHRSAYFPSWLKEISENLDTNSITNVLAQATTYYSHLIGVQNTRALHKALSEKKLEYLNTKLSDHEESSRLGYRQSFAKHHFHTYINRLPYQSIGIVEGKIRREYQRELTKYLLQYEVECLRNIERHDDIDSYIDQKLAGKIQEFKEAHFESFRRLDRIQTAINEFKNCLTKDNRLPEVLRNKKMDCLKSLEDIIYQDPEHRAMGEFLNSRLELLHQMIPNSEDLLLEHHQQAYNLLEWLIDCVVYLLEAIGLYTPERQKRYANLVRATEPEQQNLPSGWTQFALYSSSILRSPARDRQIATPGATPIRPLGGG
ncbi:MAG: hypothetical protein ACO1N3_00185 [Gammaproteobacteria bacterium]